MWGQVTEEMADLCGELYFEVLFGGRILSEKVFRCLRAYETQPCAAMMRRGFLDLHDVAIALAKSLIISFNRTPDYKEGMVMLDKGINFHGPRVRESQYCEMALDLAALFSKVRLDAYGKPEHLEEANYRLCTVLDGMSLDDPDCPLITATLSYPHGLRFDGSFQLHVSQPRAKGARPAARSFVHVFDT